MSVKPLHDDRRRYFRIQDEIGIDYRVLEAEELQQAERVQDPELRLQEQLEVHDQRIAELLQRLGQRDPLLAEVLDVMDRKLQYAINQLQLETRMTQRLAYRVHEVSISACGMAVVLQEPLAQRALLDLRLTLLPSDQQIKCHGLVLESEMLPGNDGYNTRIDFCDLRARDQETLIQHIVQRQTKSLGDVRSSLSL